MTAPDDSDLLKRLKEGLSFAYVIERELDPGGMSRVFLAREVALDRLVVIKVLSHLFAADISVERFAREVKLASSLLHANIVPVLTAGHLGDIPYYVMPFVEGESLRAVIDRHNETSISQRVSILRDVARALAFAHDHGIVHRDIKPENILLSGGAAVVTDFGIAKAVAESADDDRLLTLDGQSLGTPAYMSPEQASGDRVDARSDVYSWGVTAYELLSNRHPFATHSSSASLIRAHIAEKPADIRKATRDLPEELAVTVMRAIDKEPTRRPSSGSELYAALGDSRRPGRYRLTVAVAASLMVILIAAAALKYYHRDTVPSVAVIPFTNIGGDTTQRYFSDGVSIEISEALGRISGLRLASRSSSFSIGRSADLDAKSIASRLNVGFLVEGQILRRKDTLNVSAQLTDGTTGKILWQNRYQRKEADVFAINDDIAHSVAAILHLDVPTNHHSKVGTSNVAAHDYYIRGLDAHEGFYSEQNLQRAMALYDSAIELDPNYADPYVRKAWAWQNMADDFAAPADVLPNVASLAQKAITLDSLNAYAEISLVLGNWLSGKKFTLEHAKRSVRLAPNNPEILAFAGWAVAPFDWQLGKEWVDKGRALDSTSVLVRGLSAFSYAMCGDPLTSLRIAAVAEYRNPSLLPNTLSGAESLMQLGRYQDALSEWRQFAVTYKDQGRSGIARTYAALGIPDSALAIVHELEAESQNRYISKDYIASVYAALGKPDIAMTWLERAELDKANYLKWLRTGPLWKPLRGNRRYEAMIRRLGLVS